MYKDLRTCARALFLLLLFVVAVAVGIRANDTRHAEAAVVQQIGGFPYFLAGSGITSSTGSITLSSLKMPQTGALITTNLLSATFYLTLEPGSTSRQEFISCTAVAQNANGTATLTGCTRGLLPFTPYTASTTYAFSHSGGSTAIFSNAPQIYSQYAAKANDETISGTWTFSNFPITPSNTPASETVAGVVELTLPSEAASSTSLGGTGARLVIPTSMATDTPTRGCNSSFLGIAGAGCVPIANLLGKISSSFIATASSYIWTGTHTFNGPVNANATTTFATSTTASVNVPLTLVATSTPGIFNSNNASTTLWQYVLQGNTLGTNGTLRIHIVGNDSGCGSTRTMALFYGTGSATTTVMSTTTPSGGNTQFDAYLYNKGATGSQGIDTTDFVVSSGAYVDRSSLDTSYDTTAKTFLALRYFCSTGANGSIRNVTVEKLGSQ